MSPPPPASRSGASSASAVPALYFAPGAPQVECRERSPDVPPLSPSLEASLHAARAIVVLSAGWAVMGAARVTVGSRPETLGENGGPLEEAPYPARGHPALAREVAERLSEAGIFTELDRHRGWEPGVWGPLRTLYPAATVPIVQISLSFGARAADMAQMGAALAPLRSEGILLVGSGGSPRSLRPSEVPPWPESFESWVTERLGLRDFRGPPHRAELPSTALASPRAAHLLPLFFVLGSALPADRITRLYEGCLVAPLSLRSLALCASPQGVVHT